MGIAKAMGSAHASDGIVIARFTCQLLVLLFSFLRPKDVLHERYPLGIALFPIGIEILRLAVLALGADYGRLLGFDR